MSKAFYVWRLNPIEENLCSNPFEFFSIDLNCNWLENLPTANVTKDIGVLYDY